MRSSAAKGCALAVFIVLVIVVPAAAAPVTIDFESGAAVGDPVTNQYGPPGFLAGPTFTAPVNAGFNAGCAQPHLTASRPAFSGSYTLELDGCANGEFYPTGAFLKLGYTAKSLDFQIAETGTLVAPDEVIITAFRADKSIVVQQSSFLPPQTQPTYKQISVNSSAYDIAFVVIERGTQTGNPASLTGVSPSIGQSLLLLDDLTYDPPAAPPESSFLLAATPSSLRLAEGAEADVTIPVTWVNNPDPSTSPVSFEVAAPPGVTASVSPNPSTAGTATLHLKADKNAPTGDVTVTVDGFVDQGTPAEKHASTALALTVAAPYGLNALAPVSLTACSPTQVFVRVFTEPGFSDPLTVRVSGPTYLNVTPIGDAPGVGSATITASPQNGELIVPVAVDADRSSASFGPAKLVVTAQATGYAQVKTEGALTLQRAGIASVRAAGTGLPVGVARGPMFRRPGTLLDLGGAGFCPGSRLRFGTNGSQGAPRSIAPDGRSMRVEVPRGALSGPITLIRTDDPLTREKAAEAAVSPALPVLDYRSAYGFAFPNKRFEENFTLRQFDNTFGSSIFVQIDPCAVATLGVVSCPIPTGIPDPFALTVIAALADKGRSGLCYGNSQLNADIVNGAPIGGFDPPGAQRTIDLTGPAGPAPALLTRIGERHLQQFDAKMIAAAAADALSGRDPATSAKIIHERAVQQLTDGGSSLGGRPAIVSIRHGGSGHALLVYDVEELEGGKFALIVDDPNIPFDAAESTSASQHADNMTLSRITVDPASNRWTYPGLADSENKTLPWSGEIDLKSINVLPAAAVYNQRPVLPNLFQALSAVVLASDGSRLDQVTDGRGRRLIGADGFVPSGTAGIPQAALVGPTDVADGPNPIGVLPVGGVYDVAGTRAGGTGRLALLGRSVSATAVLGGAAASAGASPATDRLRVAARARLLRLTPGASGPTAMTLATKGRGGERVVGVETTGHKGAGDTVQLLGSGDVALTHGGPPSPANVTLSSVDGSGLPVTARLRLGRMAPGERARILVPDWKRLAGRVFEIQQRRGRATRRVRIRALAAPRVLRLAAVRARTARGRISVRANLRRVGRSRWASAGASLVVVHRRKVVARERTTATTEELRTGRASLALTTRKLARGRYRIAVVVTASSAGRDALARSNAVTTRRTLTIR